jgi:hypothetical protein
MSKFFSQLKDKKCACGGVFKFRSQDIHMSDGKGSEIIDFTCNKCKAKSREERKLAGVSFTSRADKVSTVIRRKKPIISLPS